MRRNDEDQAAKLVRSMGRILTGGLLSLGISIIILFLFSIGISSGWLNDRTMPQCTVISCVIGSLGGAVFSIHCVREKKLFVGLLTSCIQFLLILSIGFLMYPGTSLSEHGASIAGGCIVGGLLAGFLGAKPKKKRRK